MEQNKPYVLIINGSPHKRGTTRRALDEIACELDRQGLDSEIVSVGGLDISGCRGCGACKKLGKCVTEDIVVELSEKLRAADGVIVASPVYYSSPNGTLISLLDRLFYSSRFDKTMKVGASVVAARRGGTTATFDVLNKYFTLSGMPIASSYYWNQIHGSSYEEAEKDEEGLSTMRSLATNMAYLIKAIKEAEKTSPRPSRPNKPYTNFIR